MLWRHLTQFFSSLADSLSIFYVFFNMIFFFLSVLLLSLQLYSHLRFNFIYLLSYFQATKKTTPKNIDLLRTNKPFWRGPCHEREAGCHLPRSTAPPNGDMETAKCLNPSSSRQRAALAGREGQTE